MRDLRVSVKDASKAMDEPPGIFAQGKLKKLLIEYEELHKESMVRSGYETMLDVDQTQDTVLDDNTKPSMTMFLYKFGLDLVAKAIGMLRDISDNQEETYVRIAHFFYHLGRRHERSIFK